MLNNSLIRAQPNDKKMEKRKTRVQADSPCEFYSEDGDDPGFCLNCGHPQKSHEASIKTGSRARVISSGKLSRIVMADNISEKLNGGFYVLHQNMSGFYLEAADKFDLPKKIYGTTKDRATRILKTYRAREGKSMGVMCSGKPGTGKTVLSKLAASMAVGDGMPVIIIRQPFSGPQMSSFLEELPSKCMMFVDEIEKVYDNEASRHWLLSVLDGTVLSKHLWMTTCNNPDIGEAFQNRPGRIRYHYRFEGMEIDLIRGMITENVKNIKLRKLVYDSAIKIPELTPDVLYAIIEEANIHGEDPREFLDFLNVDSSLPTTYMAEGLIYMSVASEADIDNFIKNSGVDEYAAKRFLGYIESNGIRSALLEWKQFEKYFRRELVEVETDWEYNPIQFDELNRISVEMGLYPKGLPISKQYKAKVHTEWRSDEIASVKMEGRVMVIKKKGSKEYIRLTPVKAEQKAKSYAI